jgi:hypothetical protein
VACAAGPSVTMSSTDFSFQNLVSWNLFEFFQGQKSLKNQYLPHILNPNLTHINPIKILLIKIFPKTPKAHSNSFEIFSYDLVSFCSEKIIQYSRTFAPQVRTSWHQAHAPLLVKSFPTTPRT